jgi:TetR/AcrR family transcriptional regulator, cholesterol catabolism regulator
MSGESSEARERVLQAAEQLFATRGYAAVTVKDIAKAVGLHHASLYHHIPAGKEGLFVEVMERNMQRHREGIEAAIAAGDGDLRRQLRQIARWLFSQPPVDLVRMTLSDLPAIERGTALYLENLAYRSLLEPIERILKEAQTRGEIEHVALGNVAGAILVSIAALNTIPAMYLEHSRDIMANQLIDVFIRGVAKS